MTEANYTTEALLHMCHHAAERPLQRNLRVMEFPRETLSDGELFRRLLRLLAPYAVPCVGSPAGFTIKPRVSFTRKQFRPF